MSRRRVDPRPATAHRAPRPPRGRPSFGNDHTFVQLIPNPPVNQSDPTYVPLMLIPTIDHRSLTLSSPLLPPRSVPAVRARNSRETSPLLFRPTPILFRHLLCSTPAARRAQDVFENGRPPRLRRGRTARGRWPWHPKRARPWPTTDAARPWFGVRADSVRVSLMVLGVLGLDLDVGGWRVRVSCVIGRERL